MELGVHWGAVIALVIAQLHFGGNLRDAFGLPARSIVADLDLLIGDFDATMDALLGVVLTDEIIHDLP
jgi:hypothetical protein